MKCKRCNGNVWGITQWCPCCGDQDNEIGQSAPVVAPARSTMRDIEAPPTATPWRCVDCNAYVSRARSTRCRSCASKLSAKTRTRAADRDSRAWNREARQAVA